MKKTIVVLFLIFSFSSCVRKVEHLSSPEKAFVMLETVYGTKASGFFINDSLIMTNCHVIITDTNPSYYLGRNNKIKLKTKGVFYANEGIDLALIKAERKSGSYLPLAEKAALSGEQLYNISNPLGKQFTFAKGMKIDSLPFHDLMKLNVSMGSSGSAVLNSKGQVVGVVKGQHRNGLIKVIKLSEIKRFLNEVFYLYPMIKKRSNGSVIHDMMIKELSDLNQKNDSAIVFLCPGATALNYSKIKRADKLLKRLFEAKRYGERPLNLRISERGNWLLIFNNGSISFSSINPDCLILYLLIKNDFDIAKEIFFNETRSWVLKFERSVWAHNDQVLTHLRNLIEQHGGITITEFCNSGMHCKFDDGYEEHVIF